MANSPLGDIEELTLCSCCRRVFDDGERAPKLLACKHHFCLACARTVLDAGRDVYCAHCWKRTELPDGRADSLPTHGPVLALARRLALPPPDGIIVTSTSASSPADDGSCTAHNLPALWCCTCSVRACRACPSHTTHSSALCPTHEARTLLARETRDLRTDLQRLATRQRDLLLRALDAATVLKLRLEAELSAAPPDTMAAAGACSLAACAAERDRVRARHADALAMARLDDLVRYASIPLDFDMMRRALGGASVLAVAAGAERRDPVLLLGNYCTAQMFARQWARCRGPSPAGGEAEARSAVVPAGEAAAEAGGEPAPASGAASVASMSSPPVRAPSVFPLFFFEVEMNGAPSGRIVVEVRDDVAPRMARNFTVLSTGELGVGYRGCSVFQCWENESVITGDFEQNNGRGGRSVFEDSFFMPDDTRMGAVRGSVGMRRSQKRHDNLGLVGSQFRIVLREMRGFTAIFAFVVEGLELVDRLSRMGDSSGKPHSTILISDCGKLN